ncbi:hypothetical protein [Ancylobacter moscoviensis]
MQIGAIASYMSKSGCGTIAADGGQLPFRFFPPSGQPAPAIGALYWFDVFTGLAGPPRAANLRPVDPVAAEECDRVFGREHGG